MDQDVQNKASHGDVVQVKSKKNQFWTVAFIVIIFFVRIGNGMFQSMGGPTLLYLAENVDATVAQVSSVFTGRSAGFFVGSVLFSVIVNWRNKFKPLLTVGLGITLNGVLVLITPWVTNLAGLVVTTTITGLMFGYLDAAMQSIYLQIWGEKSSRPYMQAYHFAFSVGALLAPIVAAPFLRLDDQDSSADERCPDSGNSDVTMTTISYENASILSTTKASPVGGLEPVAWTYIICGILNLLGGLLVLLLVVARTESKLLQNREAETESREEEPFKEVMWFFLPVIFFYFTVVAVEVVYQSYIYSIALCSELDFSVTDASTLNTIFWVGFGLGRGSGIIYSKFFEPTTMIVYDAVGTTLSIALLAIFGRYIPLLIWFVTFFFGFSIATFYSSGISYCSKVTNVSAAYIYIFAVGNTLGGMTMSPLAGVIFDEDPFAVVYLLCGLAAFNAICFLWMYKMGERHLIKVIDGKRFVMEQDNQAFSTEM